MNRHIATIVFALATTLTAAAGNYYEATFTSGSIPKDVTTELTPEAAIKSDIYSKNSVSATDGRWFVNRLATLYAALVPTNLVSTSEDNANQPIAARTSLTLPAVTIDSPDALLRWDGRSVHPNRLETYVVEIREAGDSEWTEIYNCDGEAPELNRHSLKLSAYQGKDIEVRFTATTMSGFMLALDNIIVGVPKTDDYKIDILSPIYIGENDKAEVKLRLTNYGNALSFAKLILTSYGDDYGEIVLPAEIQPGSSAEITLDTPEIELNDKFDYSIYGIGNDGKRTLLTNGWIFRSHYPRVNFVDRASGTWCPNCPVMSFTVDRLKNVYRNQLIAVEAHINDAIANSAYFSYYLNPFCRAIPMLIPNHDSSQFVYSLDGTNDWSSALCDITIAEINGNYVLEGNKITIEANSRFAMDIQNANRYRIGYMLVADIHDPLATGLIQSNNASTYKGDLYFYEPSYILPEMMYYENVPIECRYAYEGVSGSLPQSISAGQSYSHAVTLTVPDIKIEYTNLRPIVMIFDTESGNIIANCAYATPKEDSGVETIIPDSVTLPADDAWYTLQGVRLSSKPTTPGIYINSNKKVIIK